MLSLFGLAEIKPALKGRSELAIGVSHLRVIGFSQLRASILFLFGYYVITLLGLAEIKPALKGRSQLAIGVSHLRVIGVSQLRASILSLFGYYVITLLGLAEIKPALKGRSQLAIGVSHLRVIGAHQLRAIGVRHLRVSNSVKRRLQREANRMPLIVLSQVKKHQVFLFLFG